MSLFQNFDVVDYLLQLRVLDLTDTVTFKYINRICFAVRSLQHHKGYVSAMKIQRWWRTWRTSCASLRNFLGKRVIFADLHLLRLRSRRFTNDVLIEAFNTRTGMFVREYIPSNDTENTLAQVREAFDHVAARKRRRMLLRWCVLRRFAQRQTSFVSYNDITLAP